MGTADHEDELARAEQTEAKVLNRLHSECVFEHMVQITEPGERGLSIFIRPDTIEISFTVIVWSGPHNLIPSTRLWRRIDREGLTDDGVRKLLAKARKARAAEFRTCRYCRKEYPPEHRHSHNVCHGCAEKYQGIVH